MNRIAERTLLSIIVVLAVYCVGEVCVGQVPATVPGINGGVGPQPASPRRSSGIPLPPTATTGPTSDQADVVTGSAQPGGANMPLPPTGYVRGGSATGTSGGWVSGPAALQGGPFPAYMTGYGTAGGGYFGGGTGGGSMGRPFSNHRRPSAPT